MPIHLKFNSICNYLCCIFIIFCTVDYIGSCLHSFSREDSYQLLHYLHYIGVYDENFQKIYSEALDTYVALVYTHRMDKHLMDPNPIDEVCDHMYIIEQWHYCIYMDMYSYLFCAFQS